jgi:hypothetical protein
MQSIRHSDTDVGGGIDVQYCPHINNTSRLIKGTILFAAQILQLTLGTDNV